MPTISHITNVERAKSIIRNGTIFGINASPQTLEAYPHFNHERYGIGRNDLPCRSEIKLYFECDLEELLCTVEPPAVGILNVHFTDENLTNFWQATLRPGSPPITLTRIAFLVNDIDSKLVKRLRKIVANRPLIRPIWCPFSQTAREARQASPLPEPGWFGRLFGQI